MKPTPSSLRIKSLDKALRVLEAFNDGQRYMHLSEIVEATGIEKSAVQRATHTLRENGYLEQDPKTRQFAIGRKVLELSFHFLRTHPLIDRATPVLIDLRRSARERVDMSIVDGDSLLYVVRLQSKRETFFATLIGRRVPMFCTAGGRAVLSLLPEDEAEAIVRNSDRVVLTKNTITDPQTIMGKVREARVAGYALQVEECLPGEVVVAAAVTDESGRPVGAVHIAALLGELTVAEFERRMAPLVTSTGRALRA